jgi:hypothetical protein
MNSSLFVEHGDFPSPAMRKGFYDIPYHLTLTQSLFLAGKGQSKQSEGSVRRKPN